MSPTEVTNVVIAGLGGQGVIKASDILAEAAAAAGFDVKKSEIHGMSQRGGSVSSDVRFGQRVASPMVPDHAAHYLIVLEGTQIAPNRHRLMPGGVVLTPECVPFVDEAPENTPEGTLLRRMLNVALLGALSAHLTIPDRAWRKALAAHVPQKLQEKNERVFLTARAIESVLTHV